MARHTNLHSITRTLIPVVYSLLLLFFIWPASGASAGSATLTWDPPTDTPDIDGYKVYYGQISRHAAGFSDYECSEFAGNTRSYGIEGLEEGTIYYFAVTTMDTSGNESTYSNEVSCTISGNGNQSPKAVFNADIQAGAVPLVVNFDASGSHDADGGIVEYSWRFGDGETGEGIYVSHTYVQPGQYTAELTVTDGDSATDTTNVVITVRDPFAPPEVIVDNGEAGTSSTGSWPVSGGTDSYGDNSLYSKTAGATYSFDVALHGTYEVSLWWTEWPSRSTSVPVKIYDGNTLIDTVSVNQTAQGGQWNVLGTYNFAETARVTIVSEGSSHSTCADAVKFNPIAPPEVIVDNGEAGTSFTGSWSVSGGADSYGDDSLYSKTVGATYSFDAALHGTYEVSLWWTEWPSRSTSVPVKIYDGDTLIDTVMVNQTAQGGQWNVLGTYNFAETARVTIVSEDSSHSTCADAVKFNPIATTEVIVDNGEADTSSTGSWQVSGGQNPYGDNSLYSKTADATYSFDVALHGTYEVSLWWTEWPSRSTSVPVEIYDGDTLIDTVMVNQTAQGGQWNVLGTYNFAETARVTIVSEGSSHSTCADAVKFLTPGTF